jgi:hypothetical protein
MYWDPVKSNYIPVEDTATPAVTVSSEATTANIASTEPKDKEEKVKNAQKVAKVSDED